MKFDRILVLAAGLCGAGGVALSAVAAHAGGGSVNTAASFLLIHAPAFLALGLLAGNRVMRLGSWGLLIGLALFAGDLLARQYLGTRLFPMAAPTGGTIMILSWLVIGASGLSGTTRPAA